jgi:hypothetical protein
MEVGKRLFADFEGRHKQELGELREVTSHEE